MNDAATRAGDDLAYLSQLARDDGRVLRASSIGLMAAGGVFGLMMLRGYLLEVGALSWPGPLQRWIPLDAVLLFFVVLAAGFVASHRTGGRWRAPANASSRAVWAAWAAAGVGYGLTQVAFSVVDRPGLAVLVLFALWGGGWFVMWAIHRRGWLLGVAAGCYLTVPLVALLWETPERLLALAAAFFVLVGLPGYAVRRSLEQPA